MSVDMKAVLEEQFHESDMSVEICLWSRDKIKQQRGGKSS